MKTENLNWFSFLKVAEWINRQKLSYVLNQCNNKFITKPGNTAFLKTLEELRGKKKSFSSLREGKGEKGREKETRRQEQLLLLDSLCSSGKENGSESDTICKLILLYVIQQEYCEGVSYCVRHAEIWGLYQKQAPICMALLSVNFKQTTLYYCIHQCNVMLTYLNASILMRSFHLTWK